MMINDTGFRKSNLENHFLKKLIPGTSNHSSYHTILLAFCFKFILSPVCEYLNYPKSCEVVLNPLENPKMKIYGNPTSFFLDQSWKFLFFFS